MAKYPFPVVRFEVPEIVSSGDDEYLDLLNETLHREAGQLDLSSAAYRGFDGAFTNSRQRRLPQAATIFIMNDGGWRHANQTGNRNPAQYAEDHDVPAIGVYDMSRLRRITDYTTGSTPAVIGEVLTSFDVTTPFNEEVVHMDYPHASANEALAALVLPRYQG